MGGVKKINKEKKNAGLSKLEKKLEKKAAAKSVVSSPKVVALIGFHADADVEQAKSILLSACGSNEMFDKFRAQHCLLPDWAKDSKGRKQRLTFLDVPRTVMGALDSVKCADLLIAVMPPSATFEESAFDELGYSMLSAIKSQGMPSTFGMICHEKSQNSKGHVAGRKFVERFFHSEFTDKHKIFQISDKGSCQPMIRSLANCTPNEITWRQDRGYLLADRMEYDAATRRLAVCGYVRGAGFTCNNLIHITGHGDFQIGSIAEVTDPCPLNKNPKNQTGQPQVIDERSRHTDADDLVPLRPFDDTEMEQTWPTEEELANAARNMKVQKIKVPTDVGNTNFEHNWTGEVLEEHQLTHDMDMDEDDDAAPAEFDSGDESDGELMNVEIPEDQDAPCKEKFTIEERAKEDLEFPDEVDTPMDTPARVRFQKYRGLNNFRRATWDPYEELPNAYSRIFEFEQFTSTCKLFKKEFSKKVKENGCSDGKYVCLYIDNVDELKHPAEIPMIVSSLFTHERKVTVMHATATRGVPGGVIKSKDILELHVGFRRFLAGPIYSEVPKRNMADSKRKFERFFHEGTTTGLTFYSPTMYPGAPLLAFKDNELVAWGNLNGADPLRCIIKRIVLTGYPFKCHKGKAVARHMFWNPVDIRYFKPLELITKHGLRGHITEPLGTHGYMKCRFNGIVHHHDTFCLQLYKRVFPRWCPLAWGGRADMKPEENEE